MIDMKRKPIKLGLIFILLLVSAISFYFYKLHALAVEGNSIFEQRCLVVNPPLISYKNSFLKFADFFKTPEKYSGDEIKGFFNDYITGMRKYLVEETKWLENDKKYMDSWDFKLLEPWYMKQGGEYQWKLYEGYRDDAKYLLATYDQGKASEDVDMKQKDARVRINKYAQLYFDLIDKASKINDWRKMFGRVSIPKGCTEENMRIPNTTGVLDGNDSLPPAASPSNSNSPLI